MTTLRTLFALSLLCLTTSARAAEPRLIEDFDAAWKPDRWTFSNGPEFPGAAGQFDRSPDAAHAGQFGGRLAFDFTSGGNYVAASLPLNNAPEISSLRLWIKKPARNALTFRYTDQTGQTLQKSFRAPDDRWFDALITLDSFTGHWGGANDGIIHGAPKQLAILLENSGQLKGSLLFDDLRLIEGKSGSGAGLQSTEFIAAKFDPAERWSPQNVSLPGTPKQIRIRLRNAATQNLTLRMATHFMTFEKNLGQITAPGETEITTPAPPSEGWRWYGGENDGKLHGPLRLTAIQFDKPGNGEIIDVRVTSAFPAQQACILQADLTDDGRQFTATVRSLSDKELPAQLSWTLRDWEGNTVHQSKHDVKIPSAAVPAQFTIPVPPGTHNFLEAQATLDAPDQLLAPAHAYYVAPVPPRQTAQLDPASPFGMGVYLYRYGNLQQMQKAGQMARDAGVKWSREEFSWGRIQRRQGEFDWTFYDNVVATAKRNGISVYGLLCYWTGWTQPYTPQGIDDYCRFASAAVQRYRNDIQHWEVWNEPNIFFWQGPRDMYADLLKKAHGAIKQANPNAQVLGCSTAGIDSKFIQRTMDLGAPFDILTIHPYRSTLDDRGFVKDLRKVADLAKRPDGSLREVWITEMGWATHVPHNTMSQSFAVNTQRDQATLLARSYINAIASGVSPNISWYDFRNDGTDPFNFEHNMGVMTHDFRIKPAYRAFATLTQILQGRRIDKTLDLGEDVVAYRFVNPAGRAATALWSLQSDRTVQLDARNEAKLVDLMGSEKPLPSVQGKLTVTLHPLRPVFVIE